MTVCSEIHRGINIIPIIIKPQDPKKKTIITALTLFLSLNSKLMAEKEDSMSKLRSLQQGLACESHLKFLISEIKMNSQESVYTCGHNSKERGYSEN